MPAKSITDAFVRDLTFARALTELERDRINKHKARERNRQERNERRANGEPELPAIEPLKPLKSPVQISFMDTLERGLALELVIGKTDARTWRVITYRNGKAQSTKVGSYPAMGVKSARIPGASAAAVWPFACTTWRAVDEEIE